MNPKVIGCGATIALVAIVLFSCVRNFGDSFSNQSAAECLRLLREPILRKTAEMPDDAELISRSARVEHVFHGNTREVVQLRRIFERAGWKVEDYGFEVGDGFRLVEPATQFRRVASRRVEQLCEASSAAHVEYESWWLDAPQIATFVAQNSAVGTVQVGG